MESKDQLRTQLRRQRTERHACADFAASNQAIIKQLEGLLPQLLKGRPGYLASFWPLAGEPDLRPLASSGIPLALPRTQASGLVFHPWQAHTPLERDSCGIPAPQGERPLGGEELALLLVPALAVDQRGIRLGSGGGWYDRLRADQHWRAVPALVVLPQASVLAQLPSDPWDIPFPGWITEQGLRWVQ